MQLDLKAHLLGMAQSREVKTLVCDLVDHYAASSETSVDDAMARGLRAALLPTDGE